MTTYTGKSTVFPSTHNDCDHFKEHGNSLRSYQTHPKHFQAHHSRKVFHPPSGHGHLKQGGNVSHQGQNGFWDTRRKDRQSNSQEQAGVDSVKKREDHQTTEAKVPVQLPIGPTPRVLDQTHQQTRMPYSAALLGIGTSPTSTAIVALPKMDDKGSSPISQNMEMPPTPALTSSQERSEASEVSEAELEAKREEKPENVQVKVVDRAPHMDYNNARSYQERRPAPPRECDPYGVFVSRFPELDNLEGSLASFFGDCAIRSIRVQVGKGPNSTKFAFIDFYDTDSTHRALSRHDSIFFGKPLNVKPKGMPNHAYFNRGAGNASRQQHEQYRTILGRHEDAEGVLKAACGMTQTVAPSEASAVTVCHPQAKAVSNSLYNHKGSALPRNPLKGGNGKRGDALGHHYPPNMPEMQPSFVDQYGQMAMHDGCYQYAPMYWQCPPLSPDEAITQPTTATSSPEQSMHQAQGEALGGILSSNSAAGADDKAAKDYHLGQMQAAYPMPYMPYPVYDPNSTGGGMNAPYISFPAQVPNEADTTGPHWPMVTTDPSGQQYMVQPYGGMYYPLMTGMSSQQHVSDREQQEMDPQTTNQNGSGAEYESSTAQSQQHQHAPPFPSPLPIAGAKGQMDRSEGVPMMVVPYGGVPFPQPIYSMPMQYRSGPIPYGAQMHMMPNRGTAMPALTQMRSWSESQPDGKATQVNPQQRAASKEDVFGGLDADNKPISIPAWMNDCY